METTKQLNKKQIVTLYALMDYFASMLAWFLFFTFRKFAELYHSTSAEVWQSIFVDWKFYVGIFVIPLCWVVLYALYGTYNHVWKKSRLKEFTQTFYIVVFGSVCLFFAVILDDQITDYKDYIILFLRLFGLQLLFTSIARLSFLTILKYRIKKKKFTFNTIFIGNYDTCCSLIEAIKSKPNNLENNILGYISISEDPHVENDSKIKYLGNYEQLENLIKQFHIEEVIVAVKDDKQTILGKLLPQVALNKIVLKILPNIEDHLLQTVKDTNIANEAFIEVSFDEMPQWQMLCKRIIDIIFATLILTILSPLYLVLAIGVKRSSPGSIFYRQERVGKNGRPFHIIKFRSMYENAEANGPQLSNEFDNRITKFGLFLRRTHLDEMPQFINVLKGDMSLVGHRPERQYYIDQIMQKAPYYSLLLLEKPGVTSWGQVSYGYAENVDQMIERLRYDLMYFENKSLTLDIKIIIYTILCMLKKSGK